MPESSPPQRHFKRTFLAGLLTVVPLLLTISVSVWLFDLVTDLVPALLRLIPGTAVRDLLERPGSILLARLLGLGLVVLGVYLVGLFTKTMIVRQALVAGERLVERLPLVGTVYSTVKQMGNALFRADGEGMFQKVVLIEYPRRHCYVVAFLTAEGAEELKAKTGEDLVSVFVPTTPNPTSGFLLMLPRPSVTVLDMTVTEGMRLVISGGAVFPKVHPATAAEAAAVEAQARD